MPKKRARVAMRKVEEIAKVYPLPSLSCKRWCVQCKMEAENPLPGKKWVSYSAMHKKRYKLYIQDFYAQKSHKKLFSMMNPKSWKKWSNWHQSQTFWSIWLDFIMNRKLGVVNWCKIFKWPLKSYLDSLHLLWTIKYPWHCHIWKALQNSFHLSRVWHL